MKIKISTPVQQHYLKVKALFDENLFKVLNPPFPPVKLLRFDGSDIGDTVVLELNFILFKQKWVSKITDNKTSDNEFYFIDKGVELPFFLGSWEHKHIIIRKGENESEIRDEIEYEGKMGLMSILLYPLLYGQFLYRRPIYKRYFKQPLN
ncbi:SRPBCC family protein [Pleomorphovibrio marinus]|uniref:SRPBCC family protein n=1 Tax=Pleomorphovibrio marinus TaxID=2164132 RepID=UPI000E0B9D26|nr:hypothetical protein [Pleomorphovibrio marinus]